MKTNDNSFKALIVEKTTDNRFVRKIKEKSTSDLPAGDVLIRVAYSSLNYKDALSASGNPGVTRKYPHTPGIDAAGTVEACESGLFKTGDQVIVTSYDLGMNTPGGFGQMIRVPSEWVVPLPPNLSLRESMIYGTAGFTAGMSVFSLNHTVKPDAGEILVSGATGGVGSIAVALLSKLGYKVVAVSGKADASDFLNKLGVTRVIGREVLKDKPDRPLLKGTWAGVIDTVGCSLLAAAIKSTRPWGTITTCGMVASPDLNMTVFPFILRGLRLIGIDSQNCPMQHRRMVWEHLATDWKIDQLDGICREVSLDQLSPHIDTILQGGLTGRIVIKL